MVSFNWLRGMSAFAPLVVLVAAGCSEKSLPSLMEATTEELAHGLAAKDFTSLDLVDVRQSCMCG
jgi:amidase